MEDVLELEQKQAGILNDIYSKPPEVAKAISTSNAPVGYNLSTLVTELEPMWEKYNLFLRKIPRIPSTGKQAEWYQIDSVTNGMSSSYEGGLGSENVTQTSKIQVPYKTIAVTDKVTHEAQAAGKGFLDEKGTSVIRALRKLRQKEEYKIIGGNMTAIDAPSAVTATPTTSGGNIASGTYSIKVCPLSAEVLQSLTLNVNKAGLTLVPYLDASNNAIAGKYWGVGLASSAASVTTTTAKATVVVNISPVAEAFAYAIFAKLSTDADYTLQAISTYSVFTLTGYFKTGTVLPTVDGSGDALSFDGIFAQVLKAGNECGGDLGYTQLTADETGVVEINEALQKLFDSYKVAATNIYVSGDLRNTITKANIKKGGVYNITQAAELNKLTAGRVVGTYIHPATGEEISIETHPYLPKGTVLITTEQVDLPELGVSNVIEMHVAQDYFQRDVQSPYRTYPFEIYAYEALGLRTPAFNIILKNIKNGLAA